QLSTTHTITHPLHDALPISPAPATAAGQIRKIASRDAGLTLQVEMRTGGEPVPETDGAGGEAPPAAPPPAAAPTGDAGAAAFKEDRKSTRLNSSHLVNSYAV